MSRSKKSRKSGENAPKLAPRSKKSDRVLAGKKQASGNKSGSRHNAALISNPTEGGNAKRKDPRHGSKKPIALAINKEAEVLNTSSKAKAPKLTDEQKLLKLEENPRLNSLLDMLEEGRNLSAEDKDWLDKQLTQIEKLMNKLGISDDAEAEELPQKSGPRSDDDLLAQFESGADSLKDYLKD